MTRWYCIKTAKPILNIFIYLYIFRPFGSHIILVSSDPCANTKFQGNPFSRDYIYMDKNWRFSTEIAVYLGNSARQVDGCYATLIGSCGSNGIIFNDLE